MIGTATTPQTSATSTPSPCWHPAFLKMLPAIERHARFTFRHLDGDSRGEAVQEVTCNACMAYARLVDQGRADAATWSSLAGYAIRQFHAGRRVGSSLNIRDVCSVHCQRQKGVTVERLNHFDEEDGVWREMLAEDRQSTPANIATMRVDFCEWLATLPERHREIAKVLATSETTVGAAKLFGVSAGRISQLRQQLRAAWEQFHEPTTSLATV